MRYVIAASLLFLAAACVTEPVPEPFRISMDALVQPAVPDDCNYIVRIMAGPGHPADQATFESGRILTRLPVRDTAVIITVPFSRPGLERIWRASAIYPGDTLLLHRTTNTTVQYEITFRMPSGQLSTQSTSVTC